MALLSLDEAQAWVLARCAALPVMDTKLADCLGLVLAEDVYACEAIPPFANTAMDGFAVRAADTSAATDDVPVELEIIATLAAGAAPTAKVVAGTAVRIMTGAPMPLGADSVIPVEATMVVGDGLVGEKVVIRQPASLGDCIRPAGEDLEAGQLAFTKGTVLEAGHLGVLASLGTATARVFRRPRVGVISTGDELVEAPAALGVGQIRDSNRRTLIALVTRAGGDAVDLGLVRDDEAAIEQALTQGLNSCDALVTSGGVSMGDFDFIKVVLNRLAARAQEPMRWMQIAIRPAKPLAFGVLMGKPVFGLPGNPVSSMVSFELFARPGLRGLMGYEHTDVGTIRPTLPAIADAQFARQADGKVYFVRAQCRMHADGRLHVRPLSGQGSNLLYSMALANALVVLQDGPGVASGAEVQVLLSGELLPELAP